MNSEFLIHLSEWSLLLAALGGFVVIIGASLFDVVATMRHHQLKMIRQARLPHITILVYANDNQAMIAACLESIGRSRYTRFDVVVVDNASTHSVRPAVRAYQQQHPHQTVYFYGKRKATDCLTAIRHGYAKSRRGEVVLVVDGSSTIEPRTLQESGVMFAARPSLQALRLHTHIQSDPSITFLLQRAADVSQLLYCKCRSLVWKTRVYAGELGVLYRREALLQHARPRCGYASMISLTQQAQPSSSFVSFLPTADGSTWLTHRWLRVVGALYGAFLVTYFLYTAASIQSSSLLMLSWVTVTMWLAIGIWSDESTSRSEKRAMIFCVPVLYFLAYGFVLVMIAVVIIRTLLYGLQLFKRRTIVLSQTVKYVE